MIARVLRPALGVLALVGAVAALAAFAREPVEHAARLLLEAGGLGGVFAAGVLADGLPGVGFLPVLLLAHAGGVGAVAILAMLTASSFVASVAGWALGRLLGRAAWMPALLERSRVGPLLRRHGARALAVAAVMPVPWPLATVGAGASGLGIGPLLAGAACRPVKIALTLAAVALGWRA